MTIRIPSSQELLETLEIDGKAITIDLIEMDMKISELAERHRNLPPGDAQDALYRDFMEFFNGYEGADLIGGITKSQALFLVAEIPEAIIQLKKKQWDYLKSSLYTDTKSSETSSQTSQDEAEQQHDSGSPDSSPSKSQPDESSTPDAPEKTSAQSVSSG